MGKLIEIEPCDMCHEKPWIKLKNDLFVCGTCVPPLTGFPVLKERVTLSSGDTKVTVDRKEIQEVERARILPYSKPGGGYYHGRLGDHGKIEEKPLKTP